MLTLLKRILHLIDSGGLYGAEQMLLALVAEQRRQGMQPMILSAGDPEIEEKPLEAEARRLGLPVTRWRMKPGFNLPATKQIVAWAKKHDYQVLHSHGYKFNVLLGSWPPRRRGLPLVVTLHGYVSAPFPSRMWAYEALDRACLTGADAVVIVSKAMRKRLPRFVGRRSHHIPNGISETLPKPALPAPSITSFLRSHRFNFLAAGRLSPEKGFDILLDAVSSGRNAAGDIGIVIFGEGGQRAHLEHTTHTQGLADTVILPGYQTNVAATMPHFDALVVPSRTEGMPIILLEAMRARLPIIAAAVGGMPEMLEHYPYAQLVEPENSNAFLRAMHKATLRQSTTAEVTLRNDERGARAMERRYSRLYAAMARKLLTDSKAKSEA